MSAVTTEQVCIVRYRERRAMAEETVVTEVPAEETAPAVEQPFSTWDEATAQTAGKKLLLYGASGTGKSWCGATFPRPIFIDLEGGMKSVRKFKPLRIPKDPNRKIETYREMVIALRLVKKMLLEPNCPFDTVVIDSLNEMQDLVMEHVLTDYSDEANRKYSDQPTQGDYGKALRDFMAVYRLILKFPCNVVFTSVGVTSNETEQLIPSFVGKKTAENVLRLVDAVGYCYTTLDAETQPIHVISFANTPHHTGKDRLGIGFKPVPNNYRSIFN